MTDDPFGLTARQFFALEPGIAYLDNASVAPLPLAVEAASREAVSSKARPWRRDREEARAQAGVLRALAGALVGAEAGDMAITCAVSYGLAAARRNLPLASGGRVLVLQDDHTSQLLTWSAHARRVGATLDVVRRPDDGDWTHALLDHLDREEPPAIAALCATFWRDGAQIDLPRVCGALKALGSRIVLDLTQSAGVFDFDLRALGADFAMFPMYKWLLGPYSIAFLYVAPRWQDGEPLEENVFNREDDTGRYAAGAARFDMGEKDTFVSIPTAVASLRFLAGYDRETLRTHLRRLTDLLEKRAVGAGLQVVPRTLRSPHIIGIRNLAQGTASACRREGVFFTQRGPVVRVAPHLFNTDEDVERCADALASCVSGRDSQ
jgi:selenocysteine lyase/cysteine desulfurase